MGTAGESWTAAARRVARRASGAADVEADGEADVELAARRSGAELDRRYAQPHRRYHDGAHVAAVVRDATDLARALHLPAVRRDVVVLAACAHDVVYDGRSGDDERASADWARANLPGADAPVVEGVCALILATIDHVAGDDLATQILLDADLAVLGADAAAYDAYAAAVRAEYAAISDAGWRAGRARVLRALLDHDPLYCTAPARERWEGAARANLRRELGTLG